MNVEDAATTPPAPDIVAPPAPVAPPAQCENCAAPLHGEYCYACGQSVHSPLRHAGHALEEVFESFWHLDGRIFRTLRDLLFPGRVAREYIAGHRARYVAPLRLFVILSLLTFFVAQFSVQLDDDTIINVDPDSGVNISDRSDDDAVVRDTAAGLGKKFAAMNTVAEVERLRDTELANIAKARALVPDAVGAGTGMDAAARAIGVRAQRRIDELQRKTPADVGARKAAAGDAATSSSKASNDKPVAKGKADKTQETDADAGRKAIHASSALPEAAWDAKANPISIPWLPAFANRWLTSQSDRASHNVVLIRKDPQRYMHAVISAVPSTLFVLVPVFALLLKIFYLFKRRLYMEHLVVALYSHAFLLLCLLGIFASMGLRHGLGPQTPWLGTMFGWIEGLLWTWMPIYLLLMQKAVYRQGWPMTLLKYCVLGSVYFMLLSFGAAATFVLSLVRM